MYCRMCERATWIFTAIFMAGGLSVFISAPASAAPPMNRAMMARQRAAMQECTRVCRFANDFSIVYLHTCRGLGSEESGQ